MLLRPDLNIAEPHRPHRHLLAGATGDLHHQVLPAVRAHDAGARAVALPLVVFTKVDDHLPVLCEQAVVLNAAEVEGGEDGDHDGAKGRALPSMLHPLLMRSLLPLLACALLWSCGSDPAPATDLPATVVDTIAATPVVTDWPGYYEGT